MDFIELAKSRYSCRSFSDKEVEKDKIDLILEAGKLAPTAVNFQPQTIIVVNSENSLAKIKKGINPKFNPAVAFIVCYDRNKCWVREYDNKPSGEVDASIVATHMMLEAKSIGLDSTWIMHFNPEIIKNEFSLGEDIIPVVILVMGYSAPDAIPSLNHYKRRELDDFVKYE